MTEQDPGWRLEIHDTLPSTSDLCIERAEAGEAAGLAVLARRQTRGRGSRGRSWSEPPAGNLALSVLLRPKDADEAPGLWPFLAGLALHQALRGDHDRSPLILKWPNDVMLNGRKLAGILVERGTGGGHDWLVIGFGANLEGVPVLAERQAACLAELGQVSPPEKIAERVLAALDGWRTVWRGAGFAAIRDAWLARAHAVGTPIEIRGAVERKTGRFAGIDTDGALLLSIDGRQERVGTGEILLLGSGR